jgi:hypothetical protein
MVVIAIYIFCHKRLGNFQDPTRNIKVKILGRAAPVCEIPVEQGVRGWSDSLLPDGDPSPSEQQQSFHTVPSNAHNSTPFFHKTVFFSKIFLGKPPSKFLEVCLNSEYM